ncbi:MAG: glycosyltransferase family 4 protein [Bacteroidia bacterium]
MNLSGKHILIIVENLPVPLDRRVWQEARHLKSLGADVSVICPKMKGHVKSHELLEGINIYRHPLPVEASGALGYLIEYTTALFFEFFLALKIFFRKRFHVIQGCSPPDLIFLVVLPFKLFGVKYVFDHHDLSPELFQTKFKGKKWLHNALLFVEKLTFKTADFSIATNQSFKEIAIQRGKMFSENVEIVRSGPDLRRFKIIPADEQYKKGKKYLIGYLGIIAEQDGLDLLMQIAEILLKNRNDIHFAIIGDGTELPNIRKMAIELGIAEHVDFYGMVSDDTLLNAILNTCDVCVNPDIPNELNNLLTTNKVMEYMAVKKPVVQFDLKEGRYSALEASLYARANDLNDFAEKISSLLDSPENRKEMGEFGYNRVINHLSWEHEKKNLENLYAKVFRK